MDHFKYVEHECPEQRTAGIYLQAPGTLGPVMDVYDEYIPIRFCPFCGQKIAS